MYRRLFYMAFMMFVFAVACGSSEDLYSDKFWIITSKANIYETPNALAKVIGTLKFGDEVHGREKKPRFYTPKDWLEIRIGAKDYGFVERRFIGDKDLMDELNALIEGVEDKQVQASAVTSRKARFRLAPDRNARLIEILKQPQHVEIFERVVTVMEDKKGSKKDVWYKVRLEDGRVGYIYTTNVNFTPPPDIKRYTQNRKPVSWHVLRVKEDKDLGLSGREYIVSYTSQGFDIGADFNRVEIYTYDLRSSEYATAFARSGLKGILPLNVLDAGDGRKIFQIRQLIKGKDDKLLVQEYSFPPPIKLLREYKEDTIPMPH